MKNIIIVIAVLVVIGLASFLVFRQEAVSPTISSDTAASSTDSAGLMMPDDSSVIHATFTCDSNKSIEAAFGSSTVLVSLSDGRQFILPQAVSADGGRYASADESVVFWNKGNTATLTEGGKGTYTGCATSKSAPASDSTNPPTQDDNSKPVACTMEAKQCPNGSYVGRTGPNCEFAACPPMAS